MRIKTTENWPHFLFLWRLRPDTVAVAGCYQQEVTSSPLVMTFTMIYTSFVKRILYPKSSHQEPQPDWYHNIIISRSQCAFHDTCTSARNECLEESPR